MKTFHSQILRFIYYPLHITVLLPNWFLFDRTGGALAPTVAQLMEAAETESQFDINMYSI